MIPRKIHYIWFGGNELPELEQKCIASWSKVMPDWEIVRWDESNFDVRSCAFSQGAYEARKWAFVSDYARYRILFNEGGVLLDTDVEVLKPLDDLLGNAAFAGYMKNEFFMNPGLIMGAEPGSHVMDEVARVYESMEFEERQGRNSMPTSPRVLSDYLESRYGLKRDGSYQELEGFTAYPASYFDPIDSHTGETNVTDETYSIHHYSGTWLSPAKKFRVDTRKRLAPVVGPKLSWFLSSAASVLKYGKEAF